MEWSGPISFFILRLGIGQLNFKWRENELFSERNGYVPVLRVGRLSIVWHRKR